MTLADTISKVAASHFVDAAAQRRQQIAVLAGRTTVGIASLPVTQSAQEANQLLSSAAPHLGQAVNETA